MDIICSANLCLMSKGKKILLEYQEKMEEAKELFKSMLKTSVHENKDDMEWISLENREKRVCLNNGSFDVDFCAVSGLTEELLNDKMIQGMLANTSGTFVKHPYVQKLHGYKLHKVLVICDIKPFKFALSLNDTTEENESEFVQTEEGEQENAKEATGFSRNVASLLELDKGKTFAFRDLKVKLEKIFKGFELILFQFGQKQELDHFMTHAQKIGSQVQLSIALGLEIFLNDYLLLVSPENISVGECFFSMLLSNQAGSLLLASKHAPKVIPNSRR
jgi:hypothetical protein